MGLQPHEFPEDRVAFRRGLHPLGVAHAAPTPIMPLPTP
jgi:hypothetical protein